VIFSTPILNNPSYAPHRAVERLSRGGIREG